ncbi:MAG: DUF3488 domain-containing transglutaminase family protein [Gammaproteobacteria bacterium]|nr:DUF3488 domain-containing transglutaminase family protein [Gammaproteobacteria bacterium]
MTAKQKFTVAFNNAQLAWTLVFLLATMIPLANDLPLWPLLVAAVTIGWRWWLHVQRRRVPHGVVRFLWTLANAAFVFATFRTFNGLAPGSSLLIIMAAMKLTESVRVRDLLVVIYMSFFLILANFLFDQSLSVALYSALLVWLGVTCFSQVNRSSVQDAPIAALRDSGRLLAQAVPLTLLLFVLFPRVPGPFWALPSASQGQTGLSNSMQPGSISQLLQSDAVAFRVKFEDTVPARQELYWRGPVLEHVQSRHWRPLRHSDQPTELRVFGAPIRYEMILEPHQENWLLALDMSAPDALPDDARILYNGALTSNGKVFERRRFSLNAHTRYMLAPQLSEIQRASNLNAALTGNPRARDIAVTWRQTHTNPADIVDAALEYFNQQPFVYTLSPPLLPGPHTVDDFLFGTRRGFCEHYASAFTLLMRYAGIPARVVTGYMGGEYNPISEHYTIRQSDAHAWSEVWLEERGWVRVDPTGAVAPERVEQGIAAALSGGESLPMFIMNNSSLIRGMRQTLDAINTNWNHWILGYGQERQWEFLGKLGMHTPSIARLVIVLAIVATLGMMLFALWLGWRSRVVAHDPAHAVYRRFTRRLNHLGITINDSEAASELAQRAAQELPAYANAVENFCTLYEQLRYGPAQQDISRLKRALRRIPPHRLLMRR